MSAEPSADSKATLDLIQEALIRTAIEELLANDWVKLVSGTHVLHTNARVTYKCLRTIFAVGMNSGRAAALAERGST